MATDAERLDWLESRRARVRFLEGGPTTLGTFVIDRPCGSCWAESGRLRHAIDVAMGTDVGGAGRRESHATIDRAEVASRPPAPWEG